MVFNNLYGDKILETRKSKKKGVKDIVLSLMHSIKHIVDMND